MSQPAPSAWTLDGERVALELDPTIYTVPAILKAAYKLTDRAYVFLCRDSSRLWITITAKPGQQLTAVVGEFTNELADQQLRAQLQQEFGAIQTLIVAQAFSPTNLLDSARDEGDYHADLRGAGTRR